MEQFPLGLIPGGRYTSQRVTYSPQDLFLMMTDGISEDTDASDEEFGLDRLELLLRNNAGRPLQRLELSWVKSNGTACSRTTRHCCSSVSSRNQHPWLGRVRMTPRGSITVWPRRR